MAKSKIGRVALMSIHPQFADAILRGEKQVEFRKRPLASDVTHVVLYATAPVGAVVGLFSVAGQTTAAPLALWRRFGKVGGIARKGFFDYYASNTAGTGIWVGTVQIPRSPLDLQANLGVDRPPQSFQYLDPRVAQKTLFSMKPVEISEVA